MFTEIVADLPPQAGSYALWLHLDHPTDLTVGKLGTFTLPAGDYVYLGSARGPGGLRARLGRHLRGDGKTRWHVDYLRAVAQARGFGFLVHGRGSNRIPAECEWSQKLAALPGVSIPIPGFGASDCPSGCAAHLVHLSILNPGRISRLLDCQICVQKGE